MNDSKKANKLPKHLSIRYDKWICRNPFNKQRKTLKLIYDGTQKNQEKAIRLRDEYLKPWFLKDDAVDKKEALENIKNELTEQDERLKRLRQHSNTELKLSEATKRCYRERWSKTTTGHEQVSKMEVIIKELNDPLLSEIRPEELYDFREKFEEDLTTGTVNRYMAALKTVLNMAMKQWRILPYVIHIPIEKETSGRIKFITKKEEQKIFDLLKNRTMSKFSHYDNTTYIDYIDILIYLIDTGCRNRSEALIQLNSDIDLKKREIYIWENKTDNPRTVPMTNRVYEICKQRKDNTVLFEDLNYTTLKRCWEYIREQLKNTEKDFVLHCLRHTCCTRLWQKGIDVKTIMLWMGHKSITTTMRYAHLNANSLHKAAKKLN